LKLIRKGESDGEKNTQKAEFEKCDYFQTQEPARLRGDLPEASDGGQNSVDEFFPDGEGRQAIGFLADGKRSSSQVKFFSS